MRGGKWRSRSKFSISTMNITSSSRQMMPRFSSPGGEEKAGKGADDGRQVRCIGGDDRSDADIEQQKKSKLWVCGVIK